MQIKKVTAFSLKTLFQSDCLFKHAFIVLLTGTIFLVNGCKKIEFKEEQPAAEAVDSDGDALKLHPDQPNIIIIMAEDMGYEVPTCNGGQSYQTPTLDMMAATGMRFTQVHGSPMCAPSRWMLMTGKYNFRNYFYYGIMYTDQRTFANVLQDKGYRTGVYGKWALDGGDTSVHIFGFQDYCIWNPFKSNGNDARSFAENAPAAGGGSIYISAGIYDNGSVLPRELTQGKFSDDIFTDSVNNFIKANKNRPFFAYYPMILSHKPASPTPDDPEFATWNPDNPDDTTYFASQVKYTDKKIRSIIDNVNKLKIGSETVIMVLFGDNGTREGLTSLFNGQRVAGARQQPTEWGTHVPFLVYWPGTVPAGVVNNDLIDFTDFLPTIADIAKTSIPASYGKIDGVSFYPQLLGQTGTPREWIYDYYWPVPNRPGLNAFFEWAQDKDYKLYDSTSYQMAGNFYKFENSTEKLPELNINTLTPEEVAERQKLRAVLNMMHNDQEYRLHN